MSRCNDDTLSSKRAGNSAVMDQGFSERAIVIVKWSADEIMVTWLRIKLIASDKEVGGKGRAMVVRMAAYYKPAT